MTTLRDRRGPGRPARVTTWLVALAAALSGCGGNEMFSSGARADWEWDLPPGFPVPRVLADNPMSEAKVSLGRHLFHDTRLSGNQTQSCGSCHFQERAFAEPLSQSIGSTGEQHPRNSMSLANVAYQPVLTWGNPGLRRLEQQALIPLFGTHPVELGMGGREVELLRRLREEARYRELFPAAFPDEADPFTVRNVTHALAAFQRVLISANSPYDRYLRGDAGAISAEARRGEALFFSEEMECFHCHTGTLLASTSDWAGKAAAEIEFFNTGLYNLGGTGAYPEPNVGILEFTRRPQDMGKFKAPSLRNVELTAPYFHDGSAATLDDVLDHYASGGRTIASGDRAGAGSDNPFKNNFVSGFELTPEDRAALIAYLRSLTDRDFVTDPAFSDPWSTSAPRRSP